MAFSWNWPQLARAIKDDVPAISAMLNAAVRWNPEYGGGTDLAAGMKRLTDVSGGQQIQNFNGTAWASIDKLMHDVDKLDGYDAKTGADALSIPVRDKNGDLPGSVLGNAATATKLKTARALQVGGIASGDSVNFDGSGPVTIPVEHLNVNSEQDDAIEGILTTAHGGTGRSDGAAQDVRVDSLAGEVSAKEYGQVGQCATLTSEHLDSIVVPGKYRVASAVNTELGAPEPHSDFAFLEVAEVNGWVFQHWMSANGYSFTRKSGNSGANWSGWLTSGGAKGGTVVIYVSKSGLDTNTGLSTDCPVQTIARAIRIASGMFPGTNTGLVKLCVGEGDWGNVTFGNLPFVTSVFPYDGDAPTAYSDSLPKFEKLTVSQCYVAVTGIVADNLTVDYFGNITVRNGYKRIGSITAGNFGRIRFGSSSAATNLWEIHSQTVQPNVIINIYNSGEIDISGYQHIRLADNITTSTGFLVMTDGYFFAYKGRTVFDESEYTNSGKKCTLYENARVNSREKNGAMTFFTDVLPGTGTDIRNGVIVNGYTVGQAAQTEVDAAISELDTNLTALDTNLTALDTNLRALIAEEVAKYLPLTGGTLTGWLTGQRYQQKWEDVDVTETPAESKYGQPIIILDKNNNAFASIQPVQWSSGGNAIRIISFDKTGAQGAILAVETTKNGDNVCSVSGKHVVRSVNGRDAGSDGSVRTWAINKGNVSANTLIEEGSYYLSGESTNLPSGTNGYVIVHAVNTAGMIRQVFFRAGTVDSNDYNTYIRQRSSDGTWGAWVKILTSKDTITASSATSATNATKSACLTNITSAIKTSATTTTTSKQGSCTVSTVQHSAEGDTYYRMDVTLPSGGSWHWVVVSNSNYKTGRSSGGQKIQVGYTGMFLAMRYA